MSSFLTLDRKWTPGPGLKNDVADFPAKQNKTFSFPLSSSTQTMKCFTVQLKISFSANIFVFSPSLVLAATPLLPLAQAMGSCLRDSWAYFHLPNTKNSSRTTLLFSHHSYSSQGLLTSLLISLNVLWFGQYVFTVWAKKCWGHHTPRGRSCETQLGQKLWIIRREFCLIPDKSACQCGSHTAVITAAEIEAHFQAGRAKEMLVSLYPNVRFGSIFLMLRIFGH